jgi:hypothetical protein
MSGSSIVVVTRSPFTFNVLDIAIAFPPKVGMRGQNPSR